MFRKILIANRGEIACRIIRACHDLGIRAVAVYSSADRGALHVQLADEAYFIGEAPAAESYLVGEKIIAAATAAGCDAIHPGYGFLSEREWFARAVEKAGICFIGPSPDTIELMGDKINAREAATKAGAPIVPGTTEKLANSDLAGRVAAKVGYPVMLKAAAGGGGKGMRVVRTAEEMPSAFQMASSEAQAAFGDPSVYVEKYIEKPRHIEIQVVADKHGNYAHLGERECSIQRRHQKVIEECPASFNDPELRARMGAAAVNIAKAANYYSVGTVEFLVDVNRDFYFLEMNTRLQVEHPVTELVTGIDLVREQIRIAAGEELSFSQADVTWNGHALECRVYAEDPEKNFLPSPGRISSLTTPSGPGVRDDSGVFAGWEVPLFYDPMISKLATVGRTREEAIGRMRRALREYHVGGIRTTIPFFQEVLEDPEFLAGDIDTGFITRYFDRRKPVPSDSEEALSLEEIAAAAISFIESRKSVPVVTTPRSASKWKQAGRKSQLGTA